MSERRYKVYCISEATYSRIGLPLKPASPEILDDVRLL
jgi:hypothetical protein